MARSHLDSIPRAAWLVLAVLGAVAGAPAVVSAIRVPAEAIQIEGSNLRTNLNDGTSSLDNVTLRQGKEILIKATSSSWMEKAAGDSEWTLTGKVHVEFRDAVLDADKATVIFTDGQTSSIRVQGAPANFSHQPPGAEERYQGSANTIEYDPAAEQTRFSGTTTYTYGQQEATTQAPVLYNMATQEIRIQGDGSDASRTRLTITPGKRIFAPRTPTRGTAQ